MELSATCPYCGEPISIWVDAGGATRQRYIEDCAVCCRPIEIELELGANDGEEPGLALRRDDD